MALLRESACAGGCGRACAPGRVVCDRCYRLSAEARKRREARTTPRISAEERAARRRWKEWVDDPTAPRLAPATKDCDRCGAAGVDWKDDLCRRCHLTLPPGGVIVYGTLDDDRARTPRREQKP